MQKSLALDKYNKLKNYPNIISKLTITKKD